MPKIVKTTNGNRKQEDPSGNLTLSKEAQNIVLPVDKAMWSQLWSHIFVEELVSDSR